MQNINISCRISRDSLMQLTLLKLVAMEQTQTTYLSILAAACGAKVAKQENQANSFACSSADVIEALGVVIDLDPELPSWFLQKNAHTVESFVIDESGLAPAPVPKRNKEANNDEEDWLLPSSKDC